MRYYLFVLISFAFIAFVRSEACVQCISKPGDLRCAVKPEVILAKDCANSSFTSCYTRVENGLTIRGCASDLSNETLSKCNNEMECTICTSPGCNLKIFPQHRLQCLQCDGNLTSSCALDSFTKHTVCPLYKLGDKCFIRKTDKENADAASFMRGCLSSAQENRLCLNSNDCFTCEGNGCNFIPSDSDVIPIARDSADILRFSAILIVACLVFVME